MGTLAGDRVRGSCIGVGGRRTTAAKSCIAGLRVRSRAESRAKSGAQSHSVQKGWRILVRRVGLSLASPVQVYVYDDGSSRLGLHCRGETNQVRGTNIQQPEKCDKLFQSAFCQFLASLTAQLLHTTLNHDKEEYIQHCSERARKSSQW